MKRVCLYGPESTGKTTLAAKLADHYHTIWVPEFLRGYLDRKGAPCEPSDMPLVAEGQWRSTEEAAARASHVLFADTDVLSSLLYHEFYYGTTPAWYAPLLARQSFDLYLLCHPDIPWVADGQRDMPHRRQELFTLFHAKLLAHQLPFVSIQGDFTTRFTTAQKAVDDLLQKA